MDFRKLERLFDHAVALHNRGRRKYFYASCDWSERLVLRVFSKPCRGFRGVTYDDAIADFLLVRPAYDLLTYPASDRRAVHAADIAMFLNP